MKVHDSVVSWKKARDRRMQAVKRVPMTPMEVTLNLLIVKAEAMGRLGYMAINKLRTKDGRSPGWPAYYDAVTKVKELKAEMLAAIGAPPEMP